MIGLGNVLLQIPLGYLGDRIGDRRILLVACAAVGLLGMLALPWFADRLEHRRGGAVRVGRRRRGALHDRPRHLGSRLTGRELASANAAFVLCYGLGMLVGPQVIGIGMDLFGPDGFNYSLALFFALYIGLAVARIAAMPR